MNSRLRTGLAVALAVTVGIAIAIPAITLYFHRQALGVMAFAPATLRATAGPDGEPMMADFASATDGDLSAADAGLVYRAFISMLPSDDERAPHPALRIVPPYEMAWDFAGFEPELFRNARAAGGQLDRTRLFAAARRGFSDEERAIAANVADDSLWQDFDRLARAPQLDVIGASFRLPIPATYSWTNMPIPRITRANVLSDGVGLRAAHHAASGRRDSAEAVLGRLYRIGIQMDRHGLTVIEAFLGQRLAMNALLMRKALHEAYPAAQSAAVIARVAEISAMVDSARTAQRAERRQGQTADAARLRERMVALVGDSTATRGARLEALALLGYLSCGSVRGLLLGPSEDVVAARADARRTLARSASDSLFLDYLEQQAVEARDLGMSNGGLARVYRAASHVMGRVTFNERLGPCADIVAVAIINY